MSQSRNTGIKNRLLMTKFGAISRQAFSAGIPLELSAVKKSFSEARARGAKRDFLVKTNQKESLF